VVTASLLLLASALTAADPSPAPVYSGVEGRLDVSVPRSETPGITVDGVLDEPEWQRAARLTDF